MYRHHSGKVVIDNRKGPNPVFSKEEEEDMANQLKEMAEREMGLKPYEFLGFFHGIVKKNDNNKKPQGNTV